MRGEIEREDGQQRWRDEENETLSLFLSLAHSLSLSRSHTHRFRTTDASPPVPSSLLSPPLFPSCLFSAPPVSSPLPVVSPQGRPNLNQCRVVKLNLAHVSVYVIRHVPTVDQVAPPAIRRHIKAVLQFQRHELVGVFSEVVHPRVQVADVVVPLN